MFLDRRALLQSAAALLAPPAATLRHLGKTENRELETALERYLQSMEVLYRLRRSPDGQTLEQAFAACRKAGDERSECIDAKGALGLAIIRANGIDPDSYEYGFAPLTARTDDAILIVHGHNSPEIAGNMADLGLFDGASFAIVPLSSAMRTRLESLPKFDPCYDARDEEEDEGEDD
jgi:hypothetical protein